MSLAESATRAHETTEDQVTAPQVEPDVPCLVVSIDHTGTKHHPAFHGVDEALKHVEALQNAEPPSTAKLFLMREIDLRD